MKASSSLCIASPMSLDFVGINTYVADTGHVVDHDGVNVAVDQGLNGRAEDIVGRDAIFTDQVLGHLVISGSQLGANDQIRIGGKIFWAGKAIFIDARRGVLEQR